MQFRLVERRSVPCPTLLGWILLLATAGAPILIWWFGAEAFFSQNLRLPAEVLVVEGWTGTEGVNAAVLEFKQSGIDYKYIVAAGGLAGEPWSIRRWSYAEVAERDLLRSGVPSSQIIVAPSKDAASQRTFETAIAALQALRSRGISPKAINVFTRGAHARRSRLIFAKVFGSDTKVGVISWTPSGYHEGPWWQSSVRADELIKETVGYLFELLLNSGRHSNGTPLITEKSARVWPISRASALGTARIAHPS